jgi:hypothetical protein
LSLAVVQRRVIVEERLVEVGYRPQDREGEIIEHVGARQEQLHWIWCASQAAASLSSIHAEEAGMMLTWCDADDGPTPGSAQEHIGGEAGRDGSKNAAVVLSRKCHGGDVGAGEEPAS